MMRTTRTAALCAILLAATGIATAPMLAVAAEVGAVTSVAVTPEQVRPGQLLSVTVDFAVPAAAVPGDTFTLNHPTAYVTGRAGAADVTDPAGDVIATCTTTAAASVCTYTNYIETHANVTGTTRFVVIAQAPNGSNGLDWIDGLGTTFHTATTILPSGGFPTQLAKNGVAQPNGTVRYYSGFPGSVLSPNFSVWTDTYDSRYTRTSVLAVQFRTQAFDFTSLAPSDWTATFDDVNHTFSVTLLNPTRDDSVAYRVVYDLQPAAGIPDGTLLSNTVTTGAQSFSYDFTYFAPGGGGGGEQGSLEWSKVDGSGTLLSGAQFRVTGPGGFDQTVLDGDVFDSSLDSGRFSLTQLAPGTYTLEEVVAPAGYEVNFAPVQATITPTALNASFGEVVNTAIPGVLTWSKVDGGGVLLPNAEFVLTGPDGFSEAVADNDALDEDPADGQFRVSGLVWGDYTLVESVAPEGFVLDPSPVTATLSASQLEASFGEVVNTAIPGVLTWSKVDGGGVLLPNAEFVLTGPDGFSEAVADNDALDEDPADGQFRVSGLVWGDYTLVESVAPEGFVLDPSPVTATLSASQLEASFGEVVNTAIPGVLTWSKVDGGGVLLPNAEFVLTGPDGFSEAVADNDALDEDPADGQFRVSGLVWGDYTLVESVAPEGFVLDPSPVTATLSASQLEASFGEVVNTAQVASPAPGPGGEGVGGSLPSTGGVAPMLAATTGMVLLGLGLMAIARRRFPHFR